MCYTGITGRNNRQNTKGNEMAPTKTIKKRPTLKQVMNAPNIVKQIRTEAGLTQDFLAQESNLSVLFIIRAEQGLHNQVNDALASVLAKYSNITVEEIKRRYLDEKVSRINLLSDFLTLDSNYRSNVRKALDYAVDYYAPVGEVHLKNERRFYHPFYLFRARLFKAYDLPTSQIKFCTLTGVHPAIINALENRKITIEPDSAIEGMLSTVLGLDGETIALLRKMCDDSL